MKCLTIFTADAITDMIGYPEYILRDPVRLNAKYARLEVTPTNYFGNVVRNRKFVLDEEMRKLSKPVNRTKWGMTPPAVNAYYTPTKNQIVFPAGILQSPFFNAEYPNRSTMNVHFKNVVHWNPSVVNFFVRAKLSTI